MLTRVRVGNFVNPVYKGLRHLWVPGDDSMMERRSNVFAVLDGVEGRRVHGCHNIVGNAGDLYYAELLRIGYAVSGTPTNDFAMMTISTNAVSPAPDKVSDCADLTYSVASGSATEEALTGTYPKEDDQDADNTGAGTDILTWLYEWAKGDFNDPSIEGGVIHVTGATFGSGSDPCLTAFNMSAFGKTANDTLKIFVNHEVLGV